jgi:Tetratricopeptide repeat
MDTSLFQHDIACNPDIGAQGRLLSRDWLVRSARVFTAICISCCLYVVLAQAIATMYSKQQTREGFREAVRWESWNPEHYADLARALERPLKEGDLSEVIRLYEHAVELSPHDPAYWARLGHAYEWAGRTADSRNAYERAGLLFPNSPATQWALGNFYFREGRTKLALAAIRKALLGDPDLRRPAFDLAWRATGDGDLIVREMIPARADIFFEYLDYLLGTEGLDEAARVWDRIAAMNVPIDPKGAIRYLDALIEQRRIDRLVSARSILRNSGQLGAGRKGPEANLITNGDFESEILNGGLDWRVNRMPGAAVSVDGQTFLDGTHSLRIRFDGTRNLSEVLVFQYVPVEPNTSYRFEGSMRAQGITTDSGPRFQIRDAYDPGSVFFESQGVLENSSWTQLHSDFISGPRTGLLEVRVVRPPSSKIDNRIAGTVRIDRVSLKAGGR